MRCVERQANGSNAFSRFFGASQLLGSALTFGQDNDQTQTLLPLKVNAILAGFGQFVDAACAACGVPQYQVAALGTNQLGELPGGCC